jgi:tetratricopeptide (TPR) repeat protein
MPEPMRQALDFVIQYQIFFILGGILLALVVISLTTLIAAFRRTRSFRGPADIPARKAKSPVSDQAAADLPEQAPAQGQVKRTKLAIGDVASPWTQGVYERHSPEDKLDHLLPAFAFDATGSIHRAQNAALVKGVDAAEFEKYCDTAAGLAVHGAYATLVLWHSGSPAYAETALKVASHALMAPEQKELIRFLFQDITGQPMRPSKVPGLTRWRNPEFRAAIRLYVSPTIRPKESLQMTKQLPPELKPYYELELAKKLPIRMIYREAGNSEAFSDGLYELNLRSLIRYMSPRRWLRLRNSDKSSRFKRWVAALPCKNETEALLHISNPDVFEKEDLDEKLAVRIDQILMASNAKEWLFNQQKQPPLMLRLHYFKYFCMYGRFNEAVRCYATLGIHRKERSARLYYARALFLSGMPHEAWTEMSGLLSQYPRDLAVLNEAGIYAHKLSRYDEAAEIFSRARSMFPDDATLAYNEAVFTEQHSRVQIKEKWSGVQKLSQPPVVE